MKVLLQLSTWLSRLSLMLAGVALLAMMLVTVSDVILRYLFKLTDGSSGITLTGSVEMVKYLLLIALLAAMAAHVERSQVVVEVFTQSLGKLAKGRISGVCLMLFAIVGGFLTLGVQEAANSAAEFGEVTQDLAFPLSPIYFIAAALFAVFTIRSAIHGLEGIIEGVSHDV